MMKQKVLLLMVLALGMCGTTGFAQEKEYEVGDDGFEWYNVKRTVNGQTKYGAEDRYGNMIVPTEYDEIQYYCDKDKPIRNVFIAIKGEYNAIYNKSGRCVIPISRRYLKFTFKEDNDEFGTYYSFERSDGGGICDKNGKEIVFVNVGRSSFVHLNSTTKNGKKIYYISFHFWDKGYKKCYNGLADADGKIIVNPKLGDGVYVDAVLAASCITTTTNPLANNKHETLAEAEGRTQGVQNNPVAGQQQQQSGGTTTVVVEHHRDPVPVQEWQQCPACYGSGQCPYVNCGGSGWYYIGDRATTCSMCHGSGKCSTCAGKGGHYVTVYR